MSKVPLTSIIINNYNYGHFLKEAIDSALNQTYSNIEVIVVDDGSIDNSRKIIAAYGELIIPVLKENGGQASTFNTGLERSSGDVICFLDADDKLLSTAAETAVPFFSDEKVVKVHWSLWIIDEHSLHTGSVLPKEKLPEGDFRDVIISNGPDCYLSSPTSGNMWSRKALEKVFPIPEPEYRQGADGFLLTLIPLLGTIRAISEPLGCYRVHGNNQYWSNTMDEKIKRSLVRYERRVLSLSKFLRKSGISAHQDEWKKRNQYYQWRNLIQQTAEELKALFQPGEKFIFVDEDEWGSNALTGRHNIPFMEHEGKYWGPPPDNETAVSELERLRQQGAGFIVFTWSTFWWLDYYSGLHEHLCSKYRCVLKNDHLVVFKL
jgi:glycosyltransferase involved in cell wall biosynthesis